jgi:hypothetical protein
LIIGSPCGIAITVQMLINKPAAVVTILKNIFHSPDLI